MHTPQNDSGGTTGSQDGSVGTECLVFGIPQDVYLTSRRYHLELF